MTILLFSCAGERKSACEYTRERIELRDVTVHYCCKYPRYRSTQNSYAIDTMYVYRDDKEMEYEKNRYLGIVAIIQLQTRLK